jgi:hypothetical protein
MLGCLLHAPRGPFYSPKAARSRWRQTCKAILAFCRVAHRTTTVACPVHDFFPNRAQTTVAAPGPLAHQTVRCPPPTVGAATRRPQIMRPTVGAGDRWLTGQSGAPPDSPVNYSRMPPSNPESGEFTANQPGAPDSPVCQTELKLGCTESSPSLFLSSSLVTVSSTWKTMLVHKTIYQV